jgi:AAA lid domain/ATPase family associated with various cellular activities (AAA)
MGGPLEKHVSAFVDAIDQELTALAGESHRDDCLREASDLVGALLDADGRLTDAELRAWVDDVGSLLSPPMIVTPQRLRDGEMLAGAVAWIDRPSTLFDLLLKADARDGERRSNRYYDLALKLAHATAAIDLVPSADEIDAIDRFRSTLLTAMDVNGVPRPGRPSVAATAGSVPVAKKSLPELPPERPLEELLAELDELIGLDHVKEEIRRLTSLLRIQRIRIERDLPTVETSHHLVFTGNPGTGKTTVARLLSQIFRTLDVVTKGHLVETDRSELVAGYVGQTAVRTRAVLESALGGTLLIDEAYALARGGENDFGLEAIDTLVKFMEDHRDDLAVVAAGYPEEMRKLIEANPGLESRFTRTIDFPDYTDDELVAIFDSMSSKKRYDLDPDARKALTALVAAEPRTRGFGNARFVRNVFEQAVSLQAMRLATVEQPTDDELTRLVAADIRGV